jgi:hypothetical protein
LKYFCVYANLSYLLIKFKVISFYRLFNEAFGVPTILRRCWDDLWIRKNSEGSGRNLIEVGSEESHEKPATIIGIPAEIRTEHLPDTCLELQLKSTCSVQSDIEFIVVWFALRVE